MGFVSEGDAPNTVPFVPKKYVDDDPKKVISYKLRKSVRWITNYNPACKRVIGLPYIDNVGRITSSIVTYWRCHPLQAIASITSTVYHRLLKVMIGRHKTRYAFKIRQAMLEVSAMYSITNDISILNRFYGIHRKACSMGPIKRILRKKICKLDADQRFVLRQVCSQTNWLTFRSERPTVKSRMSEETMAELLTYGETPSCPCFDFPCYYGSLCTTEFPRSWNPVPLEPTPQVKLRVSDGVIGKPVRLAKPLRKPIGFRVS